MFARIGLADDGVSVKTPDIETATMPNEVGVAPARALLPPQPDAPALGAPTRTRCATASPPPATSCARLTKALQATLPPRPD
jgi:hypothetical protein